MAGPGVGAGGPPPAPPVVPPAAAVPAAAPAPPVAPPVGPGGPAAPAPAAPAAAPAAPATPAPATATHGRKWMIPAAAIAAVVALALLWAAYANGYVRFGSGGNTSVAAAPGGQQGAGAPVSVKPSIGSNNTVTCPDAYSFNKDTFLCERILVNPAGGSSAPAGGTQPGQSVTPGAGQQGTATAVPTATAPAGSLGATTSAPGTTGSSTGVTGTSSTGGNANVLYGQPPQAYVPHPSFYDETGVSNRLFNWSIPVDADKVLIVGGYTVGGISKGVYKAFAGNQTVNVSVTDGFASVIKGEWGNQEWCFRIAQANQYGWLHQTEQPLTNWKACDQLVQTTTAPNPSKSVVPVSAAPAPQASGKWTPTGQGNTLPFDKGADVIGTTITLEDGTVYSQCYLKAASQKGTVFTGVIWPSDDEKTKATACVK